MFISAVVTVAPSNLLSSALDAVRPFNTFKSLVEPVKPSNLFNSVVEAVSPSNLFNSSVVTVAPSNICSSATSTMFIFPVVKICCEPKSGEILVPAIAAEALMSALTIVPSNIFALVTAPLPNFSSRTSWFCNS